MRTKLRAIHLRRPSHGTVVAYLALFVALGTGSAWAVATIGSNDIKRDAVKSKHIKKDAVKKSDIRDDAVGSDQIAADAVGSAEIADETVGSTDVTDNGLTGDDIDESTLGSVPNADQLGGRSASAFIASALYKRESPVNAGTLLVDGTFVAAQACFPGDSLLSGGPANIRDTTDLLESFPAPGVTNAWQARINKNGVDDNWNVVVLCADQP